MIRVPTSWSTTAPRRNRRTTTSSSAAPRARSSLRRNPLGAVGVATLLCGVAFVSSLSTVAGSAQPSTRLARSPLDALGVTLSTAEGSGQAAPGERPQLAEEVFKNVQVLKGIPVKEFMGTMG